MKRKHWTQTAAGRKRMAALARKRRNGKEQHDGSGSDKQIAYALGYVEAWVRCFARGQGLPEGPVAHRVGVLLSRATVR